MEEQKKTEVTKGTEQTKEAVTPAANPAATQSVNTGAPKPAEPVPNTPTPEMPKPAAAAPEAPKAEEPKPAEK